MLFSAPEFNERVELQASPTMLVPSHRGVVWLEWQSRVLFELRNDSLEARRLIDLPAQALDYSVRLEGNAAFFLQEEESWARGPMAGEARQSLVTINLATGVARTLASGIHNARALHVTKNALLVEGEESVREPRSYALTSFSRLGHAPRKVLELPVWFSVVATTETHLFVRSLRRGIAKVPRNAG